MRHFRDTSEMVEAMADEARRQGCEIDQRDGRTIAIVKLDCECGVHAVTEIDLSAIANQIWEAMS